LIVVERRFLGLVAAAGFVACSRGAPAAPDAKQLLALHEKVMRAHRESNVNLLLEDGAPASVVANRGEISRPSLEETRQRLGPYLSSTRFQEYRDLVPPIVTVSKDGTLGWVVVQIQARGVQTNDGRDEPLEFVSAWVELYQKRDGRWWRVGNVSNFKP
jgi:hypothetical protein